METKTHTQKRYCVCCRKEQEHIFVYLDKYLKSSRCLTCNLEYNNKDALFDLYIHDRLERILSTALSFFQYFTGAPQSNPPQDSSKRTLIKDLIKVPLIEFRNVNQIWSNYDFDNNHTVALKQRKLFFCLTKFWSKKLKTVFQRIIH